MEEKINKFDSIIDDVRDYLHVRQEILKLRATEKISGMLSAVISFLIIIPFFLLAFLFVSVTLAHLFAEWWGREYAGYLTVTLLYTVIGLILIKYRKNWLANPIRNSLIRQILSK